MMQRRWGFVHLGWFLGGWITLWGISCPASEFVWEVDMARAQRWNHRYFGDLLDRFPGLWVRDLGLLGQWAPFRAGGADPKASLVCLDGRPLVDPWSGAVDLTWIPTGILRRIRVYPDGDPYGLLTTGAVVDLETSSGEEKRPVSAIRYRTAGNGYLDLDVSISMPVIERLGLFAGGGKLTFAETIPGLGYLGRYLRAGLHGSPIEKMTLRYEVFGQTHEHDVPYPLLFPDRSAWVFRPCHKVGFSDHRVMADLLVCGVNTRLTGGVTAWRHEVRSHLTGARYTVPVRQVSGAWSVEAVPLGISFVGVMRASEAVLSLPDGCRERQTMGQAAIRLSQDRERWEARLDLSVTTDQDQRFRSAGRISLGGKPRKQIRFGGALSRTWRWPTLGEISGQMGMLSPPQDTWEKAYWTLGPVERNPGLHPERSDRLSLFWEWRPSPRFEMKVRPFYRLLCGRIRYSGDEASPRFLNAEGEESYLGIEAQTRVTLGRGFIGSVDGGYLRTQDERGHVLLERPNFWGAAALSWSGLFFHGDLQLSLEGALRSRSAFWTLHGDQIDLSGRPGALLDLQATATVMRQADVYVALDNVFGTALVRVAGFPMQGRTFRYGLRWTVYD